MFATPPFSLAVPQYDQGSYIGRCRHFYASINPLLCLETAASVRAAQAALKNFAEGRRGNLSDKELWKARRVVESCVHPTSGEVIPPPFRMAAFIPTNLYIVPYMVLPTTVASPARTMFIHWFNQSYNCLINYSNRSSNAQPLQSLLEGYAAAVTVSLLGALSATFALRRMGGTQSTAATVVRAVLPMLAVSFAGSANVAIMRRNEWHTEGLAVKDEDGAVVGLSKAAGWVSLEQCAAARVLWNLPSMMLPPLLYLPLRRIAFFARRPVVTETALCVAGLCLGVAPALAVFPTTVHVPPSALEPNFHACKRANGEPVKELSFYKGL
jgi:tricarboxylate carrier